MKKIKRILKQKNTTFFCLIMADVCGKTVVAILAQKKRRHGVQIDDARTLAKMGPKASFSGLPAHITRNHQGFYYATQNMWGAILALVAGAFLSIHD